MIGVVVHPLHRKADQDVAEHHHQIRQEDQPVGEDEGAAQAGTVEPKNARHVNAGNRDHQPVEGQGAGENTVHQNSQPKIDRDQQHDPVPRQTKLEGGADVADLQHPEGERQTEDPVVSVDRDLPGKI